MNRIEFGDCRDTMRRWAADGVKVQTCVTSPPYFGLRDYGHEGQIGLEQTPEEYITAMVEVFRCVRDVLADDGTLWLNIGDSYATGTKADRQQSKNPGVGANRPEAQNSVGRIGNPPGCKTKDLIGIPWMLAFALRADGWYLRQDIIWHKPNPMPESVRDRCTKAHEYIFLLSKSERYFFDSEAIRENSVDAVGSAARYKAPFWENGKHQTGNYSANGAKHTSGMKEFDGKRNKRSVWTVNTKPYKGAHFATFPTALIEPCVLAGSKPNDIVLDPFMGSGTTAQVAILHGRQYLGCELNQEYGDLQQERITKATPQKTDEAQMSLLDPLSAEA
jgi:DNA modification methylase